jgi:hypothetical protein
MIADVVSLGIDRAKILMQDIAMLDIAMHVIDSSAGAS